MSLVRGEAEAALGGDDADRHGLVEVQRVADRHHPLADPEPVGVAERQAFGMPRGSILSSARSVAGSRPTIQAVSRSPVQRRTSTLSAFSTTW